MKTSRRRLPQRCNHAGARTLVRVHDCMIAVVCGLILSTIGCVANDEVTLRGKQITAVFGSDPSNGTSFGALELLVQSTRAEDNSLGPSAVVSGSGLPVWSIECVASTSDGVIVVQSTHGSASRTAHVVSSTEATFNWSVPLNVNLNANLNANLNVTLHVSIVKDSLLEYRLSMASSDPIGIWSWTLYPSGESKLSGGSIFDPSGFGVVHYKADATSSYQREYPQATMQFMASFPSTSSEEDSDAKPSSLYVGAHDPYGASKVLGCAVSFGAETVRFSISATPPGAGQPLSDLPNGHLAVSYPVVVSLFKSGSSPDWHQATEIYRDFVLPSAIWTQKGPLSGRTDVPAWAENLTVWVNTHWQANDIFNISGGAPAVVESRVAQIVQRFALDPGTLGLHWYEWDTLGYREGSNYTDCASEITCGFDTHYPEYFPPRENFQDSLQRIQRKYGVRVAPYINGRIFDKGTKSWSADDAEAAACKSAAPALLSPGSTPKLSLYNESYGSRAEFSVMCPHTNYWQDILVNVVDKLTNKYATDGVYVDQVAAAGPRPCWDPSHNHTLGGGHHWTGGYAEMLHKMRQRIGGDKLLLTESNAEAYMSGIDMYLTLVGFSRGDLSPPAPGSPEKTDYIVPAFQSIYGGYVLFMGAEFLKSDFLPNPDVFAAKVANQMLFGAQMGWFSLGGRSNCPDYALFDLLMDTTYDPEVDYLARLSSAKRKAQEWLVHGRAMRSVDLIINGTSKDGGMRGAKRWQRSKRITMPHYIRTMKRDYGGDIDSEIVGLAFNSVMTSTWKSAKDASVLVLVTTVERDTPADVGATINMQAYGFASEDISSKKFDIFNLETGDKLGTFPGDAVRLHAEVPPRDIVMLRIAEVKV